MARLISSRSKWKGPYSKIKFSVYKFVTRVHYSQKRRSLFRHKTPRSLFGFLRLSNSRASVILPKHIKARANIAIYNGRYHSNVKTTSDHRGYRLGEFNLTARRGSNIHKNNAKTKKNKTKK